ncbi:MAG: hypothetical protein A2287_02230 [Candidatus Melainabacteria bacterium RIFOXYA12_FULL_32_12]|nr:MAG: hypothetical protein A2255_10255 [Candidatus Melainabacteria bacterium RIFOXYA2_FULL_32_9]OGI30500.1 MAG: hypothetical protein A2287_02230 [Candidatus Melainabacteria bacterium RIFOXYA12_FULL_32_12]
MIMELSYKTNENINRFHRGIGKAIPFTSSSKNKDKESPLPKILYPHPSGQRTVNIPVPFDVGTEIIERANKRGVNIGDYLKKVLRISGISPEPSVSAIVGNTKVTTLIGSKQIFDETINLIKNARNNDDIQIKMFEFQNLKIDGDIWASNGAETVAGWKKQQEILDLLVKKKKGNPNLKIQVILDDHKWYEDSKGKPLRHYNNQKMIEHLRDNNIDAVPAPMSHQGGSKLQHDKLIAVGGRKVIIGGMNWGNHSPANHDACVLIETLPKYKHSEVDNIISEIFNKDWAFAWKKIGDSNPVNGPVTKEEQKNYGGIRKVIHPESVKYSKLVKELYGSPECQNRYRDGKLDLPEVKPIENPAIKILTTSPREYSEIGAEGSESIGNYVKEKLDSAKSLKAELFVLSHPEIVEKIISRHKEAQKGGRPFDAHIILYSGIPEEFPYCQNAIKALYEAGVPLRMYQVNEEIEQRMHSKWAVFDDKELLIGSANWSMTGLESNLGTGKRNDYPLSDKKIDTQIYQYKPAINVLEEQLSLKSIFNKDKKADMNKLKHRKKMLVHIKKNSNSDEETSKFTIEGKKITLTKATKAVMNKLIEYYDLINIIERRKGRYKRGNHECSVVIDNPKITSTFLNQFKKDWDYSEPSIPDGYGANVQTKTQSDLSFKGNNIINLPKNNNTLNLMA